MNQFAIPNRLRLLLLGLIVVGLVSMGATWMTDDVFLTRFWSNFLHNAVFYTGISLMATFFIAVCITAYAGWHTLFKRVWESFAAFLIPGLVLMTILAVFVYMHKVHLYHWADADALDPNHEKFDKILFGKAGFLNINVFLLATIIITGIWCFFAYRLRSLSLKEDEQANKEKNFATHRKMRVYAAIFLPIAGFTSAAMIWQWIMSIDAHWYSTMFAWYTGASWFVSMIAMTIMVIIYLKGKGHFPQVTNEHIHDLGKFLFAFSIFWTYLWFSQYMLIWYANVGEETIYFKERMTHYPVLFYGNLLINFILPFFVLMRNDTKRKYGSVFFVSAMVFFGHWWDFFQMIKPGALLGAQHALHGDSGHHETVFTIGYTLPGFLEIGTALGFLGFFLLVIYSVLSRASLTPKNDPYLEESIHHHV